MKVKDINGVVVPGLIRTPGGGLMVSSASEYHKYIKDKEAALKITQLQQEVEDLKQLVHKLLEKNNG